MNSTKLRRILPSWLQTALQQSVTIVTSLPTGPEYCLNAGDCTIIGGNAGGTYQGIFSVSYYRELENGRLFEFAGNFSFTGGTGVFAGITGSGSFSGTETYLNALYGLSDKKVQATFSLPVPEPEGWAMMLAGIALVGVAARRSQA